MSFGRKKIKNDKKSIKIFFVILIILILILGFLKIKYDNFKNADLIKESREIKIESNDNFGNLGKKIPEIDNIFYKIYLKNNKIDFELKKGNYKLEKGDNLEKILKNLKNPVDILTTQNVTIIPGWNIYDIDKNLEKKGLISKGEFINYVTNKEKIQALKEFFPFLDFDGIETLEGYLYPDTYKVDTKNFKINALVIMILEEFEKQVYEKDLKGKYNNKKINEILNLASIVQKEESIEKNKPIVAGILKKRLNSGWMIGADATVCYPQKLPTSECTQKKVVEGLYNKNEYNTRQKKGLPKNPIANPTKSTIDATINDEKTKYWYYLHDLKTGQIYYAETNEEHEKNKRNVYN